MLPSSMFGPGKAVAGVHAQLGTALQVRRSSTQTMAPGTGSTKGTSGGICM